MKAIIIGEHWCDDLIDGKQVTNETEKKFFNNPLTGLWQIVYLQCVGNGVMYLCKYLGISNYLRSFSERTSFNTIVPMPHNMTVTYTLLSTFQCWLAYMTRIFKNINLTFSHSTHSIHMQHNGLSQTIIILVSSLYGNAFYLMES